MNARRFLFCVPTMQLSGGVKVMLEMSDRLVASGHAVDLFSFAGPPEWREPAARFLEAENLEDLDMARYDFVVVTPAMFVPQVLPLLRDARCIFLAQDYESFHHARGGAYEDFMAESPALAAIYRLPVPIVTISRPLVDVIRQRIGRTAYYVPMGIDKSVFVEQPRPQRHGRKRVLLVGNYLMPYKGMRDGLVALERLAQDVDVELVLITQEERGRDLFSDWSFPIELHFCPADAEVPPIMGSCDVYCCTSWYEGLGLPAIEAFHCGLPVVSTRTIGVGDYGRDGVNLLLAEPNAPEDLHLKLRRVLTDADLAEQLRSEGFRTAAAGFDWADAVEQFLRAVDHIDATYSGAGPVDPAVMSGHLDALERQGSYTPIEVVRRFWELSNRLDEVSARLRSGKRTREETERLEELRLDLMPYIENPDTQYCSAFRAKYDLCTLLVELLAADDTAAHIQRVLARQHRTPRGPAFVERRYSIV
jgi:glycosyltransferase involved in cell wall biosynthesis